MSTKKTDLTNSEKILNSDIYDLTEFVDDIKKININGVGSDKETLLVGMYGYLGYEFTSLLQNAIVVSSELANEAIPTRAKFDRNVITHALSLGVKKVAATAATMKVLLMFPERALRNNMIDEKVDSSEYTNEINEYKRKEKALKQVIDSFEDNSYIDKAKLNALKENLCQIRLYISNLESELNILTL